MAAQKLSAFTPEQTAQFHHVQQIRRQILRKMGDILEVWRGCENAPCVRARSCQRSDHACLFASMQALPDEERQTFRYAVENGRDGLAPDEAIARAQARVEDEIARLPD